MGSACCERLKKEQHSSQRPELWLSATVTNIHHSEGSSQSKSNKQEKVTKGIQVRKKQQNLFVTDVIQGRKSKVIYKLQESMTEF